MKAKQKRITIGAILAAILLVTGIIINLHEILALFVPAVPTNPCPGGTYTGVNIGSNTIGLDLPGGSPPCITGGSIQGNGKGVNIRDAVTPTSTATGTTGIQCGGSNGPMDCGFQNVTVEGFDTGIRNTSGSKSDLNGGGVKNNGVGVYSE